MKKTVRVVKDFEYEIEINDSLLNQEFVSDFERSFWELDGYDLEEKIGNLFEVVAHQLANGETNFIEGIGDCTNSRLLYLTKGVNSSYSVIYTAVYEETETEIVE